MNRQPEHKPRRRASAGLRINEIHIFWMAVGAIIAFLLSGQSAPPKRRTDAIMQNYAERKINNVTNLGDKARDIDLEKRGQRLKDA